ncbi:MAG: hypothetical protein PVF77_03885 [Anaerolineae bacterium]|jgi:hypothetical protein
MDSIAGLWALARNSHPLWIWVLGSVLIYGLAANALWLFKGRWRSPYRRWLVRVGRFLFFLAVPYLALGGWPRGPYQGLLSLEDMGIVGLDERWSVTRWLEATGVGLGWGLVALLILALALVVANRRAGGTWLHFPSRPWWLILMDGLCLGVHWAFYRSALAVALEDVYAGVFLGLGLIYLEWSLNPFWRHGWRKESQAATIWLWAALALVVALLFFLTRNLWICLAVFWLLEFALRHLGRERAPSAQPSRVS